MKINKGQLLNILLGVITAISLFFTIYFYYNDKTPKLSIAKIGEINVLEINRNLDELQILYKDVDIKNSDNNIIIITFRIENKGRVNITKDLFDDVLDWGIEIKEGEILQVRLINSNNKYIAENLEVSIIQNKIIFSKVILEKNAFFDIEIVLFKNLHTSPEYFMIGKIAGIETEKVEVLSQLPSTNMNYFQKIIDGNILVHLGRCLLYLFVFIVFCLIVVLILLPFEIVSDLINKRKRRKKIASLPTSNTRGRYFYSLSNFYQEYGINDIKILYKMVKSENELKKFIDESQNKEAMLGKHPTATNYIYHSNYMEFLKENEIFKVNNDVISIDKEFISEIKKFTKNIE